MPKDTTLTERSFTTTRRSSRLEQKREKKRKEEEEEENEFIHPSEEKSEDDIEIIHNNRTILVKKVKNMVNNNKNTKANTKSTKNTTASIKKSSSSNIVDVKWKQLIQDTNMTSSSSSDYDDDDDDDDDNDDDDTDSSFDITAKSKKKYKKKITKKPTIKKPTIKKPTTKKPITKKPTTTATKKSIMSKKSSKKEFNNGVSCNKSDSHNECGINKVPANNNNNNNNSNNNSQSTIIKPALKFRSSPAITPSLYFAVTQQQGWETGGLRSEQPSRNTHPDMEDAYYVPYMANEKVHYPSDTPYTLFVLADGHGGSSASRHFCRMVPEAIQDVLCSQASWSFREPSGQQLFREKVKEMYKRLDNEYLNSQKKKFSEWLSNGCKDPMPSDQGSTLVIVILYDGVVINCNLGDSMALICKTLPLTTTGRIPLEIVYQSTIHSPGHPHKAYHIASNGGIFKREDNEKLIKATVNKPPPINDDLANLDNNNNNNNNVHYTHNVKHVPGLLKARIYRPEEFQNPYGMQSDLSLNLGDTMGDLYFKLDPPLFPCDADVDYIVMESGTNYIGILAPDGLWDHLKVSMREFIRKLAKYINYLIASEDPNFFTKVNLPGEGGIGGDESSNKLSETESVQQQPFFYKLGSSRSHNILTGEQLYDLARALCDRTKDSLDIFEKDQGRYDDCTVIAFSYSF